MAYDVDFRPKTGEIPTDPGVYRFLDENGRVLYVGKAKNLRARLSSYFAPLESLQEKTRRMVQTARDVNWTIVKTEFEALQLEFTWIKEFDPPFNVRFKDDKSYPYLAVTMGDEIPRAFITRNKEIKNAKYFGPYTQSWAIRETLDTLLKVYPVRSCTSGTYQRAKSTNRPCLLADIGKCSAPCVSRVSPAEHKAISKELVDFMNHGDEEHIESLRTRMMEASQTQQYELAASLRDDVTALETVLEKSTVVFTDQTDADLFGIADDELTAAVSLFRVRGGRIRGVRAWVVDKELERSTAELVEYLLQNVYGKDATFASDVPKEVLVPLLPEDSEALGAWLSEIRGSKVDLRVPQRGDKRALAETAHTNAKHALGLYKLRRTADFTARTAALGDIQRYLNLSAAPLRIECFDVSHLGGTGVVASMVVFEDGLPKKDQYRKFNIEETTDDTESIYQVLTRRLKYLVNADQEPSNKFSYRPGLLIVDGGQPQVNAAQRALNDLGITDINIVGLAKRLEEIWLPNNPFPTILPRGTEALFLLQRVRDEAHRFAITAQRLKRKSSIATELLNIEGLGEKRVTALLRRFGSAKRLRAASVEEIAEVAGIGQVLAESIIANIGQTESL
ncbi:MAG: excinuclease ABC subunit UvrC [Micrococcales bacterium]|nr:excinuclease ABC subunit UvrC [Micrococcales bacterium]NBS60455.1 excinuclease ABC subunit UvrC [Microbacteriaceae bacterium]NBS85203.1 excinuclease ABC subunit UvrC [Micrococcales bacterium]NBX94315.1 excinuclease ABC subunit UvrC [Actinomycetota bacterium]